MITDYINHFTFNGYNSYSDMGMIITETPAFPSPERDMSFISIPGRSGDIIKDNGRFKNVTISYKMAVLGEDKALDLMIKNIKAWLFAGTNYFKLSDTYTPGYYRYAAVNNAISFEQKMRLIGLGTIRFNCKPFMYLTCGDEITTFTAAGTSIFVKALYKNHRKRGYHAEHKQRFFRLQRRRRIHRNRQ